VIDIPVTMNLEGGPGHNSETHHAKGDHDDSFAGTGRHFGGDAQRARSSMNPDKQLHDAPVADQVRSEKP